MCTGLNQNSYGYEHNWRPTTLVLAGMPITGVSRRCVTGVCLHRINDRLGSFENLMESNRSFCLINDRQASPQKYDLPENKEQVQ